MVQIETRARPEVENRSPRRTRIAFVVTRLHGGGAERQMLLLARELRAGHDVRFFVMRPGGLFAGIPRELGIEVHSLGWFPGSLRESPIRYALGVVHTVVAYMRLSREVDIVEAWLPGADTLVGLAQPFARVPLLVAGRRSMPDVRALLPRWWRVANAIAARQFDVVVANSDAAARDAIRAEGLKSIPVRVIRNGVDLSLLVAGDRSERRRDLGIRDDEFLVGCVANYKPGKGLETLVEVAARLKAHPANLRFILVGDGPLRRPLERLIVALGVGARVILAGSHSDARRLYPAFDLVVQASESEGLPNAILEAAAAGKPIVATDVGGTNEVVRHGCEALLVPPRDADALEHAILELLGSRRLRRELGAAARDRSLEFSPRRFANQTMDLYREFFPARRPQFGSRRPRRATRRGRAQPSADLAADERG